MAERRESVRLDLTGNFTTEVAKAALAVAALRGDVEGLGKTSIGSRSPMAAIAKDADKVAESTRRADTSINQLTGRLRLAADLAIPAVASLTSIGAVAVPAVTGLAAQLGVAAVGMGTLMLAAHGVGDAFEAVVEADLEPTAENIDAARTAMERLAPEAQEFVRALNDARPMFRDMRNAAATGLFPGVTETIGDLEQVSGIIEDIFARVGGAAGGLAAGGGDWLVSDDGREFLTFIRDEAPQALSELGSTLGAVARGLGDLWMAFTPLNQDFSSWLLDAAQDFERWADGLSQTQGFAEFVEYVRSSGPIVADSLQSIANMFLQIIEASAPLGGPILKALGAVADIIAGIADSDLGAPIMAGVVALTAYNRALSAVAATQARVAGGAGLSAMFGAGGKAGKVTQSFRSDLSALGDSMVAFGSNAERTAAASERMRGRLATLGKSAGLLAGLGFAATGAADGLGLTNTASLALIGTVAGPWGAAIGGAAGLMMDLRNVANEGADAMEAFNASMSAGDLRGAEANLNRMVGSLGKVEATAAGLAAVPGGALISKVFGLDNTEKEARDTANAMRELDRAQTIASRERRYAAMFREQAQALRDARGAARTTARSFIGLGDSLDDSKVSLGQWIRDMEQSAADLRNFRLNAQRAADKGLRQGLIRALQEAGPEGARRMRQLANATDAEIDRANRAWARGRAEMQRYVNFKVPPKKVDVDTSAAQAAINALEGRLRAIRDEDVFVNVRHTTTYSRRNNFGPVAEARGGVLDFYANGGMRERHVAQIAPAGSWRVWAEPETGGEAYIPLANDWRRSRAIDIWEETGRRLNRFAEGGIVNEVRPAAMPASVSVGSPSVSVGGAQVRVFIDGSEVRAIAEEVVGDYRAHDSRRAGTVYSGVGND